MTVALPPSLGFGAQRGRCRLDDCEMGSLSCLLQAGARTLSSELASPPIDLVLAEAAAAVIQDCRPAVSHEAGKPVQEAVPAAVLSYLSRRVCYLTS